MQERRYLVTVFSVCRASVKGIQDLLVLRMSGQELQLRRRPGTGGIAHGLDGADLGGFVRGALQDLHQVIVVVIAPAAAAPRVSRTQSFSCWVPPDMTFMTFFHCPPITSF